MQTTITVTLTIDEEQAQGDETEMATAVIAEAMCDFRLDGVSWEIEQSEPVGPVTLHDCDECGASNADCVERMATMRGAPCCARCYTTATHGQPS